MISNKDNTEIYNVACCEHSEHLRIDHKLKNLTGNCQEVQKEQKLSIWVNLEIKTMDLPFLICTVHA